MAVRLKFLFYKVYWLILPVALIAAISYGLLSAHPISFTVAVAGTILSLFYFVQKQKLEELKVFREIFQECNARYDEMNEEISRISSHEGELAESAKELLVDYFNLCGEEYLYYSRGVIDPAVWRAWENGIKYHLRNAAVRDFWEQEKSTNSYYGLSI